MQNSCVSEVAASIWICDIDLPLEMVYVSGNVLFGKEVQIYVNIMSEISHPASASHHALQ